MPSEERGRYGPLILRLLKKIVDCSCGTSFYFNDDIELQDEQGNFLRTFKEVQAVGEDKLRFVCPNCKKASAAS